MLAAPNWLSLCCCKKPPTLNGVSPLDDLYLILQATMSFLSLVILESRPATNDGTGIRSAASAPPMEMVPGNFPYRRRGWRKCTIAGVKVSYAVRPKPAVKTLTVWRENMGLLQLKVWERRIRLSVNSVSEMGVVAMPSSMV